MVNKELLEEMYENYCDHCGIVGIDPVSLDEFEKEVKRIRDIEKSIDKNPGRSA